MGEIVEKIANSILEPLADRFLIPAAGFVSAFMKPSVLPTVAQASVQMWKEGLSLSQIGSALLYSRQSAKTIEAKAGYYLPVYQDEDRERSESYAGTLAAALRLKKYVMPKEPPQNIYLALNAVGNFLPTQSRMMIGKDIDVCNSGYDGHYTALFIPPIDKGIKTGSIMVGNLSEVAATDFSGKNWFGEDYTQREKVEARIRLNHLFRDQAQECRSTDLTKARTLLMAARLVGSGRYAKDSQSAEP